MKKPESNANKSKKLMSSFGYLCDVTEKRLPIPGRHVSVDMFNLVDLFCIDPDGGGNIGVQATSRGCVTEHIRKYMSPDLLPILMAWIRSGERFCIHGWDKGPNGKWRVAFWVAHLNGKTLIWDYVGDDTVCFPRMLR